MPKVTKDILKLIKDMHATTLDADGLGIAAPQVGVSLRICVSKFNGKLQPMINPEIMWRSDETEEMEEGCLSLPRVTVSVVRSRSVTVKYLDVKGQEQERKLEGMDARAAQHEVDHLNGVLIVDYQNSSVIRNKTEGSLISL